MSLVSKMPKSAVYNWINKQDIAKDVVRIDMKIHQWNVDDKSLIYTFVGEKLFFYIIKLNYFLFACFLIYYQELYENEISHTTKLQRDGFSCIIHYPSSILHPPLSLFHFPIKSYMNPPRPSSVLNVSG